MVSREEIDDLFEIFFDHSEPSTFPKWLAKYPVAPHVPLIYREFHTPDVVLQRSQFLCTVYILQFSADIVLTNYQGYAPSPPGTTRNETT